MLLNLAGLIYMRFSVFLKVLWGRRGVFFQMDILPDTVVSVFSVTHSNDLESSLLDIWNRIWSDSDALLHGLPEDGCHFFSFYLLNYKI